MTRAFAQEKNLQERDALPSPQGGLHLVYGEKEAAYPLSRELRFSCLSEDTLKASILQNFTESPFANGDTFVLGHVSYSATSSETHFYANYTLSRQTIVEHIKIEALSCEALLLRSTLALTLALQRDPFLKSKTSLFIPLKAPHFFDISLGFEVIPGLLPHYAPTSSLQTSIRFFGPPSHTYRFSELSPPAFHLHSLHAFLGAHYTFEQSLYLPTYKRSLLAGELGLFSSIYLTPSMEFGPYASARFGSFFAGRESSVQSLDSDQLWFALSSGIRSKITLFKPFFLELKLGILARLTPYSVSLPRNYAGERIELFHSSPFTLLGSVALGVEFEP